MTKIKLLSAGLIATAMLATPAMAREHYVAQRHVAAAASTAERDVDGRVCVPAPAWAHLRRRRGRATMSLASLSRFESISRACQRWLPSSIGLIHHSVSPMPSPDEK
ncbi:hypothetical protein AB8Z38_33910 [Bradyrhizobium sp. LLZ17]|uniref:Uncharacterized protein n=1 Tax=Bradyrhizobium sp. LLZ17 TaxID=3239388 RepID=A0AB39XJ94_9BRAD